jgi:flagellar biosynthetic protein FliR
VIVTWAVAVSLLLARVGAFVNALPILSGNNVPRMVRAGLTLALSLLWFDFSAVPNGELFTTSFEIGWLAYGIAMGREVLLGTVLGYAFGLILVPARVAGEFIIQQMGLTLGNIADPTAGNPTGPITQVFEMLGILLFLGMDGHHVFLAALYRTLARWPVGGLLPAAPVAQLVSGASAAEEWGLLLIAPLGLCLFLTTVVLALMTRAAPQMNIFSVGFALQIGIGLVGAFLLLPDLLAAMVSAFGRASEFLIRLE